MYVCMWSSEDKLRCLASGTFHQAGQQTPRNPTVSAPHLSILELQAHISISNCLLGRFVGLGFVFAFFFFSQFWVWRDDLWVKNTGN